MRARIDAPESPTTDRAWQACVDEWAATDDYPTLLRLGRRIHELGERPEIARRLVPVRVGVLSDATVDLIVPVLKPALVATGLRPDLWVAPYGQVSASLLDPEAPLTRFAPQVVVVATTTANLPGWPEFGDSRHAVDARIDEICGAILGPCAAFHERTGAEVILNTFHSPSARALGNLGAKLPFDPVNFVRRLNVALGDRAPRHVHINDVALLAERLGTDRWFDDHYWYEAKQPVAFDCIADYCRNVAALIGALLGRTKKCLVLDLDNTLWGGVVGDDGLGGIRIGPGSAVGEAHTALQQYLRQLKARGVLLAVSSKNDEAVARSAFTDHPDMVLRLEDFVAFKINWSLKSDNIRAIARELDLPLEALVFLDDNPAERAEVARALPEVTVVPLPDDPAGFVRALERVRAFEAASLTSEDIGRTAAYQARRVMLASRDAVTDVRGYLASLAMRASIGPFDEISIERVTQLVNKTNQFNLTTPRVVPAEIRRMLDDPAAVTCSVRLRDRYADHGLISVVFGRVHDRRLTIDAWLMSCRVLGRGVERLVFNHLLETAHARQVGEIVGAYRPTSRNGLVKDHYATLGFRRLSDDGAETWSLDPSVATALETFITLSPPHDTTDVD